jgi:hypothetical protein
MLGIYMPAEQQLASQGGLCSIYLVSVNMAIK